MTKIMQLEANFQGRVQGVFFRQAVKDFADELSIKGYVCNKDDGSVEVVAIGEKEDLDLLIQKIKKKPGSGSIAKCSTQFGEVKQNYSNFRILI